MPTDAFAARLREVGTRCAESDDLNEREVVDLFIGEGVFAGPGYGTVGEDVWLQTELADGESSVDDQVAKLYGLTTNDGKVIDDFLGRF